jgi:solute carrier family 50 protein (sugar transporter)
LGWVSYSFVTNNFFVLVSNLPGLILSIWLNIGAAKLQYLEKYEMLTTAQNDFNSSYSLQLENDNNNVVQRNNNNNDNNDNCGEVGTNITTPTPSSHHETRDRRGDLRLPSSTRHEHWVIQVLIVWGITLSLVVFVPMSNDHRSDIIGTVVNLNLIVFYGAPLSTILHVFKTRSSASIHRKTLGMYASTSSSSCSFF